MTANVRTAPRPRAIVQQPRRLVEGSRVGLVAPAGPLASEQELERAIANARTLGWQVTVGANALARLGYFAGDDAARLADFRQALHDEQVDGIWCLRGGYGAMRLLPQLSVDDVAAANKPLIGYSDVTALHALWQQAGVVSYHGPTARAELTAFSREILQAAVAGDDMPALVAPQATTLRAGQASGTLAGGNLAILAALCGTPYQPDFRDAIVVIEDIGEAVYRIDRMLVQLRLAGAFNGCAALAFGQFTDCPESTDDGRRALCDILLETADAAGVPAVSGIPVGHIDDQWTLPFGAQATLDTRTRSLTVHSLHVTPPSPSSPPSPPLPDLQPT